MGCIGRGGHGVSIPVKVAPELDVLNGVPVSVMAFDAESLEWVLIFTDGRRLTMSAGDDPYFYVSESLN